MNMNMKKERLKKQIVKVIIDGRDAMIYYLDKEKIRILESTIDVIDISETESALDLTEMGFPAIHCEFENIVVKLEDIQYK
ncbi:hypothetical protein [Bacillus thuringiensis]|uniref:hypothetical protein n=1 Tax=Bacillus thuringiensis TaxID=1428 RepID=UPI0021D68F54|nr:hypothetical protein [Bacillus thuringiensis]MCU7667458.1 hypothetical protein [Bacillus thuringiensis]